MQLKTPGKIVVAVLAVALAIGGYQIWQRFQSAPNANGSDLTPTKIEGDLGLNTKLGRPLVVAVNQWPGWLGGIFANNGLKANKACVYWQDHNLLVEFKIMDDPVAMMNEFAAGRIDVAWSTMDTAATAMGGLKKGGTPCRILFQVDYSQGGDAVIARSGINKFEDLAGKTVALIPLSPSDTLLRYGIQNSSLSETEKKGIINRRISQDLPNDVVATFAAGKADAIVTWEPNISAALKQVKGSKVIFSSETAATLIGDCFLAKEDFIRDNKDLIKPFIKGWFSGAFKAQNDPGKSTEVMMDSFPDFKSLGRDGCIDTFSKVKLTSLADNAKTFGLDGSTGQFDTIYNQANNFYVGAVQDQITAKEAKDDQFIREIYMEQAPEQRKVTPTEEFKVSDQQREEAKQATPIMTKPLTIQFATGAANLSEQAKNLLDAQVVPLLRTSSNAVFRIEGNTDSVGNPDTNLALSQRRANAVVQYLVNRGFNADRLIPVGNGQNKPVADNNSEAGRSKNRRTDIKIVAAK